MASPARCDPAPLVFLSSSLGGGKGPLYWIGGLQVLPVRERHLLEGERHRRERLTRTAPGEGPPPGASPPLQWSLTDQQIERLAVSHAMFLRSLDPTDQERAVGVLEEQLTVLLPPLTRAEVMERIGALEVLSTSV
jgi:hypothetical protein